MISSKYHPRFWFIYSSLASSRSHLPNCRALTLQRLSKLTCPVTFVVRHSRRTFKSIRIDKHLTISSKTHMLRTTPNLVLAYFLFLAYGIRKYSRLIVQEKVQISFLYEFHTRCNHLIFRIVEDLGTVCFWIMPPLPFPTLPSLAGDFFGWSLRVARDVS